MTIRIKRRHILLPLLFASLGGCGRSAHKIVVSATPNDAQLRLHDWNGDLLFVLESGVPAEVPPGDYVLEAHRVGFESVRISLPISKAPLENVRIALPRESSPTGSNGVVRVSHKNPRYFTNDSGEALYLTGSHTWNNLVDMDSTYPPRPFDFNAYLEFLSVYNHNAVRLWAWELTKADSDLYERRVYAEPHPWLRTGPGLDISGHRRFDLDKHNEEYFVRLRDRVKAAQRRGFFVIVMLFEGWGAQFEPGKRSHPFGRGNNINRVDFGADPRDIYTLKHPRITAIQELYTKKVIETLNDIDNVLYEIANEAGGYSTDWQYHMIQFVRDVEAEMPKRHPVGMTFQAAGGSDDALFASNADWVSPREHYRDDPPASDGRKVVIVDTDHLGGSGFGSADLIWKSFTRGLHTLMMDRYVPYDSVANTPFARADEIRRAMGATLDYARRVELNEMTPEPSRSSSGYALASTTEMLAYFPFDRSQPPSVDLTGLNGRFAVEWFEVQSNALSSGGTVEGGGVIELRTPFPGAAVVYLTMIRGTN